MRYDAEHKQKTHEKLLKVAAAAIRAEGPHRVGVAGVMAKAGLTHGGFYAHFDSKEALILEAIDTMFEGSRKRLQRETEGRAPAAALSAYLDFYLSPGHRDALANGCPVAALTSDLPRLNKPAQERFAAGGRRLIDALAALLAQLGYDDSQAAASSMFAEMLGALSLARTEPDRVRSDAFLANSKAALKRRLDLELNQSEAVALLPFSPRGKVARSDG